MNWKAFLAALPLNILLLWAIYKDIKEEIEYKNMVQKKLDNLKRDNIYLDLSIEEMEMLSYLAALEKCSEVQYLRSKIKDA